MASSASDPLVQLVLPNSLAFEVRKRKAADQLPPDSSSAMPKRHVAASSGLSFAHLGSMQPKAADGLSEENVVFLEPDEDVAASDFHADMETTDVF